MHEPGPEQSESRSLSRVWIVLLLTGVAVLAAALALILTSRDEDEPGVAGALQIGWAIADEGIPAGTLILSLEPAGAGVNDLGVDIDAEPGSWAEGIEALQVRLLPLRGNAAEISLDLNLDDGQSGSEEVDLTGTDKWEAWLMAEDRVLATIFLLTPDPNLHGNDAIPTLDDDPAALALYQQASANVAAWHRVRYEQQTSNGAGQAVISYRDVNDGADGSDAGFRYFTPGGLEAIVIGTTAWSRYPGEDWEVRQTNAMIPPSEWGGEYLGATGFQLGPMSSSPAGPCRMITFVVPASDRQAVAWYAWCIDEATGQVQRDSMISRAHYMITEFSDIDGDIVVERPAGAPESPEATPVAGYPDPKA